MSHPRHNADGDPKICCTYKPANHRGRHESCIHVSPAVARVLPGRDGGHAAVLRAYRQRRALHPPPRPGGRLPAGAAMAVRERWTASRPGWRWWPSAASAARNSFPCSDVDLLYLCADEQLEDKFRETIRGCNQAMWDLGLRASPMIRTPQGMRSLRPRQHRIHPLPARPPLHRRRPRPLPDSADTNAARSRAARVERHRA